MDLGADPVRPEKRSPSGEDEREVGAPWLPRHDGRRTEFASMDETKERGLLAAETELQVKAKTAVSIGHTERIFPLSPPSKFKTFDRRAKQGGDGDGVMSSK
eukprot:CAMPEP_0113573504 /NCGR_PEP_ID=MMETSP0015_2-20120614/26656_1 /TAXON_ID=2838 /ORGANISM="Odontella" /LENGTH=101 /DNA_ID=CAMNT_0000476593 /DNA_START=817 /DNA_END=1122 /DNA_ORIENTATION=- /assembly_acc=CAM_ASM_000160